jgi:hypothetical protein
LHNPFKYAVFHFKGIVGFFIDPGRFDLVNFFNLSNKNDSGLLNHINKFGVVSAIKFLFTHSFGLLLALAAIVLFKILKVSLFIRLLLQKKNINLYTGFVIIIILYVSFLTGPLGASRFFMPLEALYIGCGLLSFKG